MATTLSNPSSADINDLEEIWEWIESFDAVLQEGGPATSQTHPAADSPRVPRWPAWKFPLRRILLT